MEHLVVLNMANVLLVEMVTLVLLVLQPQIVLVGMLTHLHHLVITVQTTKSATIILVNMALVHLVEYAMGFLVHIVALVIIV